MDPETPDATIGLAAHADEAESLIAYLRQRTVRLAAEVRFRDEVIEQLRSRSDESDD